LVETNDYLKHLEWEILQDSFQIKNIEKNPNLPQIIQKIELWRDDTYSIQSKLLAIEDTEFFKKWSEETPSGEVIETFSIKGTERRGSEVELHNCYIKGIKTTLDERSKGRNLELDFSTHKIEVKYSGESEIFWLTDWYLNGSNNLLPRATIRETSFSHKRLRIGFDEIKTESTNDSLNSNRDFACIDTGQIKFLLTKVHNEFGPKWSHNFGIEYRSEFGFIPSLEQREAIREIVSFILGKQLIHVGYTKYQRDGKLIERCAISPTKDNIVSLCQKPSSEPIDIANSSKIESTLNQLVPSYLSLREELDLEVALYIYWESLEAPLGTNLPILASALEIIMKKWFKSNRSKSKALYMEDKKFRELLSSDLDSIKAKFETEEFGGKIFSKIRFSYNMSVSDRFKQFFDEIELKTGDIEDLAIKSRHKMAHGDIKSDDVEFMDMLTNTLAYQALFNRVFLKILGYDGDYIDLSTLGYPNRHINIQLGGDV
jgi:uncharacterized beta-barrel protein YwiB (DUF1934 family)